MDTSWCLPEFRLGDTFDRLPAPSLWLVRWGKAEEEESNKEFMNAMKQAKINGGHPVKYPHSDSQSWMSLLYGCKELLHLISWMGNPRDLESDSLMNLLLKSYTMIALWSPWRSLSERWRLRGNDTSCSRADQYGRKLRFKDFCRHPDVALPEGFKIPKFSKYNGVGDPYHHLLSFCGDCRGLDSQSGLLIHLYQKSL